MVKVRGKGLGYVALQDIEPGTLLISDPPILVRIRQEVKNTFNMVWGWMKTRAMRMREMRNDADNAQICAYVCKYAHI